MQSKFGSVSVFVQRFPARFSFSANSIGRLVCCFAAAFLFDFDLGALSIRNVVAAIEADPWVSLVAMFHVPAIIAPPLTPDPSRTRPGLSRFWLLMVETVNRLRSEMACQVPTKAELLSILTLCRPGPMPVHPVPLLLPPDTHALSLSLIKFSLCKCQCTKTHTTTEEGLSTCQRMGGSRSVKATTWYSAMKGKRITWEMPTCFIFFTLLNGNFLWKDNRALVLILPLIPSTFTLRQAERIYSPRAWRQKSFAKQAQITTRCGFFQFRMATLYFSVVLYFWFISQTLLAFNLASTRRQQKVTAYYATKLFYFHWHFAPIPQLVP